MSEDVFQIITSADIKALKMQLALQCSPLLVGLKVSNLLIVSSKDENHVRRLFRRSGITARVIYKGDGKTTFLLYRPDALEGYLKLEGVRKLLLWLGYKRTCLEEILDIFCCRYNSTAAIKWIFPMKWDCCLVILLEMCMVLSSIKGKTIYIPDTGKSMTTYPKHWSCLVSLMRPKNL